MPTNDTPQHNHYSHLLQTLSAMMVQVNALQALLRNDHQNVGMPLAGSPPALQTLRDGLATLEQMTREVLHEVRSISEDAPLAELIGVTLTEALSHTIEETAERLALSTRIAISGEERTLPGYSESLLYSIAQEALYQVEQRTGTRKLRLIFSYGHDEVQMSIEDDGIAVTATDDAPIPPFATTSPPTIDAVLSDLRHHIEHLGGSLVVEAKLAPEQRTRVLARIPYVQQHITTTQINVGAKKPGGLLPLAGTPQLTPSAPPDTQIEPVRVLVVEAQAVTRAGLRRLVESYPDLEVIGEAADGIQAVSETLELGPQVVLMDMQLPNGQSLEALRQIKQLNLNTHVLLLSALDREEYLYQTLRAGAGGYVLKDIAPDELAQAIRTVARGEVIVQPQLARRMLSQLGRQSRGNSPYEALTAREHEVLHLLAQGLRNKEMAARLHLSERTINFHLANIYQKLNVSGRTQALSKALEQGLIIS